MENNIKFRTSGRVILGRITSKGEEFEAKAFLSPGDKFSELIGKSLVKYRLEVMQRRRDLENTEEVIETLKGIIDWHEDQVYHRYLLPSQVSKHWMHFNQEANDERKSQLENIAFAEMMIHILSKSNGDFNVMREIVHAKYPKNDNEEEDPRKIHLLNEIASLEERANA